MCEDCPPEAAGCPGWAKGIQAGHQQPLLQ